MAPLVRLMQPSNTSWVQKAYLLPGGSHSREREREAGRQGWLATTSSREPAMPVRLCVCVCVCRVFTWAPAEYLKQLWRHQRRALRWVTGCFGPSLCRRCAGAPDAHIADNKGDKSRGLGYIPHAWIAIRGWPGSSLFSVCLFYCCVCFNHGCSHRSTRFGNSFYFIYPCHYH